MPGNCCNNRAATAATCGVAAEVPKKFGNDALLLQMPEPPAPSAKPRKVSLPPSGPAMSGFWRISPFGGLSGLPELSNRIGSPPLAENVSSTEVVTPHRGVSFQKTAPTAITPVALGCPCSVPPVTGTPVNVDPAPSSSTATLMRVGAAPATSPTWMVMLCASLHTVAVRPFRQPEVLPEVAFAG